MASPAALSLFGIRHHGPGSALSLRNALRALAPDIVLVEGPADANEVLTWLGAAEMEPPVALVIYAIDEPRRAAYFPFAVFSPEYQAIRYALSRGVDVRFMDLPQAYLLASNVKLVFPDMEPLQQLAHLAGFSNHEAWWNQLIEQRIFGDERDDSNLFKAVFDLMAAVRTESEERNDHEVAESVRTNDSEQPAFQKEPEESAQAEGLRLAGQREAFMRQTIREAQSQGFKKIAVVCGAYHGPALADLSNPESDRALLADMARLETDAAWVPWTYGRLSQATGYGSGIHFPGWYHHLWEMGLRGADATARSVHWLTQVANLLRDQRFDASSAEVIEAVRLAEALAALRDKPHPGLSELMEATQTVLTEGKPEPIRLIRKKLIVSERMGYVPEDSPMVPLQRDLLREQRRLRLRPEPEVSTLNLDLRKKPHLERSHLLHRLRLLNIPWGKMLPVRNHRGTYREVWRLHWMPELTIRVIEANIWGNTLRDASSSFARDSADRATELPALTHLLDQIILAELPEIIEHLMLRIEEKAALSSDLPRMIDALPPLVQALRYGSVRQTDKRTIAKVVDGLLRRIYIGLPHTCASLADEAAQEMYERVTAVHHAVRTVSQLLDKAERTESRGTSTSSEATEGHRKQWYRALQTLMEQSGMHGLIAGRSCRLLVESGTLKQNEALEHLQSALVSTSLQTADVLRSARWIEGFLKGSGLVLLHDQPLLSLLDTWVMSIGEKNFIDTLPILRRTFADFSESTRRQLSERIRQRLAENAHVRHAPHFDPERAAAALPLAAQLLGVRLQ